MAVARPVERGFAWADVLVGAGVLALAAGVVAWATHGPRYSPESGGIVLSYARLPLYALDSWLRMAAAYVLSLGFAVAYAWAAVFVPRAGRILVPVLDVLQSIPILSFLPVVLVGFVALFPHSLWGPNLASVVLIFTSQAWNLVFALYSGFITVPRDLREAALSLGLSPWQRLRYLELPAAMVGLVWNSMMSWAGGWFFLMAAEMFSLGNRDYQLPGLGSFLQTAANRGDWGAEWAGLGVLVAVIVVMDQLVFRPCLAWAEKFKTEQVPGPPVRSAVLMGLRRSVILARLRTHAVQPLAAWWERRRARRRPRRPLAPGLPGFLRTVAVGAGVLLLARTFSEGVALLLAARGDLGLVLAATGATLLRVVASLVLATVWTVPLGVVIGLNRRLAAALTPVIQILAAVPATALFPGVVALLLHLHGGLNIAAVLLMALGTQWYVLFNVIAGTTAIPEDLKEAARLFGLRGPLAWRTLILPAIFPHLVTGLITASGGAWNASIVAEYVSVQGQVHHVFGVGWLIAASSVDGRFPRLLLATVVLAATVVAVNRLVWRPLYRQAANRYAAP
ncbi:MAG: ABC transporter permease subunit [Actinomycetia bacterium]|nr:ABC transporter permease subunit [Actinomycetes bacterium]